MKPIKTSSQVKEESEWTSQICGNGGLITSLNSRLFLIRRLSNYISKKRLNRVADSLYASKIRYGLQLLGKVRIDDQDSSSNLLNKIQVTQNKFMRFMGNRSLLDKIPTKTLFEDTNLLSVNQLNAQCKLLEVWKSLNNPGYPIICQLFTL